MTPQARTRRRVTLRHPERGTVTQHDDPARRCGSLRSGSSLLELVSRSARTKSNATTDAMINPFQEPATCRGTSGRSYYTEWLTDPSDRSYVATSTPQATRPPLLPVGWVTKSSGLTWMTIALPSKSNTETGPGESVK